MGVQAPSSVTAMTAAVMVGCGRWVMVRSCLVMCCSGWNVLWGSAGCAADEEPAPPEGAFDNEFYFAKTDDNRVFNVGEINILDI